MGWFGLGFGDWARLVPFGVGVGGVAYLSVQGLMNVPGIGPVLQVSIFFRVFSGNIWAFSRFLGCFSELFWGFFVTFGVGVTFHYLAKFALIF